ncbi:putative uncharacterized protein [Dorea sp. CAG:317]|nr:putative uncharacterized protein [Dorea sp. CAG:317]
MKKRLLSVLLCAGLIASLAVGCGGGKDAGKDGEKETLSVWLPPLDDETEKNYVPLLDKFEEENNCELDVQIIPWDTYEEKYMTGINADEGPDVGYMYVEMFPTYIDSGAVVDMSEYLSDEDYEEYLYLDKGEMMGGQYGVPIVTGNPFIMYYNKDILDELGEKAPETWEDFKRICEKATKDTDGDGKIDQYGYAAGFNNGDMSPLYLLNSYYYSLLWQSGSDIYNDDLKSVRFNDEAGVKAVEYLKSLTPYMPEDYMSLAATDAFSSVFGGGKAAFACARAMQAQTESFKETYPDLNWDYVTSLKGEQYGTFGAADCLTLMSACENKELGMKLIKYMVGSEVMTAYHKEHFGAPMTADEPYQGDEKLERILTEDRDKWRPLQAGPCGSDILLNLTSQLQAVMSGDAEAKEALDEAADYSNELLDEYWADKE